MFLHIPGGKENGVKIIPISEVAAKDEFLGIGGKPRRCVGIAPRTAAASWASCRKTAPPLAMSPMRSGALIALEIGPLMRRMMAVNAWAGARDRLRAA
jgi:hypothetical protein